MVFSDRPPTMLIRQATQADFSAIWDIFQQVIEPGDTYVFDPDKTTQDDALEYWFGKGVISYVATLEEQVVGMYKLVANQRDRGSHVVNASFMVKPAIHGRGIGK
jgi:L-amino acid N-acyltransferase YncA